MTAENCLTQYLQAKKLGNEDLAECMKKRFILKGGDAKLVTPEKTEKNK